MGDLAVLPQERRTPAVSGVKLGGFLVKNRPGMEAGATIDQSTFTRLSWYTEITSLYFAISTPEVGEVLNLQPLLLLPQYR